MSRAAGNSPIGELHGAGRMIDNKWFCEPSVFRESWCFLSLEKGADSSIGQWEIGYGNPGRFVRKAISSKSREVDIIGELLQELFNCRRRNIPLITLRADCLQVLRTRILLLDLRDASLRGLKCIYIERALNEFFPPALLDPSFSELDFAKRLNIKVGGMSVVELLWAILLRVGPLLPEVVI